MTGDGRNVEHHVPLKGSSMRSMEVTNRLLSRDVTEWFEPHSRRALYSQRLAPSPRCRYEQPAPVCTRPAGIIVNSVPPEPDTPTQGWMLLRFGDVQTVRAPGAAFALAVDPLVHLEVIATIDDLDPQRTEACSS